mmetsp:Transcript_10414/g.13999  ORF Transcript_10414/g.13999 Transcript_10414/m.13999 type:complete len:156 (-) Transcript_10414:3975-4442(-)
MATMEETDSTRRSSTFFNQSTLPRLPIPTLEETLEKFPGVVSSLQNSSQNNETKQLVKEFLEGDGPKLQELLVRYDKSRKFGSYVEEFWNEAYLAPDCSTVLNLNPFFVLEVRVYSDLYMLFSFFRFDHSRQYGITMRYLSWVKLVWSYPFLMEK